MSCHDEAQRAIDEQEKLNRVGTEIYVNFRFFLFPQAKCICLTKQLNKERL